MWANPLRIWSHLLNKSLMEDFIFCAVYSFYLWESVPSCYLNILKKLHKRAYRTVFLPHSTSLEPFSHHQNINSLILLCRFYFGLTWPWYYFYVSWLNWFPGLSPVENPPVILIGWKIFRSSLPVMKMSISTVSFL